MTINIDTHLYSKGTICICQLGLHGFYVSKTKKAPNLDAFDEFIFLRFWIHVRLMQPLIMGIQ